MSTKLRSLGFGIVGTCLLAACGGGGSGAKSQPAGCTVAAQKQAVADLMREWYFFNDEAEQQQKYAGLDLTQFASPAALLTFLRYRPERFDRDFSFLTTPAVDQQFFGAGQFVGFGFGSKFADAPVNSDLRLTQVFGESPAAAAGLTRGQRVLAIDGRSIAEIQQAEGLGAALGPDTIGLSRTFSMRRPDGSEFSVAIAKALVTIDPVPFVTTFTVDADVIAYLDMRTFVATADAELEAAFADFLAASANALVVDLRYNGGGLVATAERLADLIGGFIAAGQIQSQTRFNSAKSNLDSVTLFAQQANSLDLLQQVVFITTGSSASASELIINALEPHTVVGLIGAPTFGKPVGQSGLPYCGNQFLLRALTFETVNALGAGQYYDGLEVDCSAGDELERHLGDPQEASLAAALDLIQTGSCPVAAAPAKPSAATLRLVDVPLGAAATSARRHAGAF